MPSLPAPKTGILDIAPYVAGKPGGAPRPDIVKLSANETPLGPSKQALQALSGMSSSLHRYPDSGVTALRNAIGETYAIDPDRIVCGAGSDELIGLLIHAYAGPGDEILMSRHGFLMYKIYAQGFGVSTVMAPEKNLRTDVDAMLAAVTPRTKIVFVANPNNPTGSYITRDELKRLHAGLPPHVLLAVDAAYSEYATEKDYSDGRELVDKNENAVMLRTFSKIYGLAALRLGWAYAPAHVVDVLNRIRGPFNVSAAAQAAGMAAVRDKDFIRTSREFNAEWRGWLAKELAALGLTVYPSIANFVLIGFPQGNHNAAAADDFLVKKNLVLREVKGYGLPDCLRLTVGLKENNHAVIAALKTFLA